MSNIAIGDIGELSFMLKAKSSGLEVLTPYSSNSPYDVMVDNGIKTYKIQVKTTSSNLIKNEKIIPGAYKVSVSQGRNVKKKYSNRDVDFFAIYILPHECFYIIPFLYLNTFTVNLYPEKTEHKYNEFKENWELLKN